jgi:hypothetical protein
VKLLFYSGTILIIKNEISFYLSMKVLNYVAFISLFISLTFLVYRQSKKKGFRTWIQSIRLAFLIAAAVFGFLPFAKSNDNVDAFNQVYQEQIISDQEVSGFENDSSKIILAGRDGTGSGTPSSNFGVQGYSPSNFPTLPPPSRRPTSPPPSSAYRSAPKIVNQGLGAGAGANPAGGNGGNGGNGAEFDDKSSVPKEEQSKKSGIRDYDYTEPSKQKEKKKEKKKEQLGSDLDYGQIIETLNKNSKKLEVDIQVDGKQYKLPNPDRDAYLLEMELAKQIYETIRQSTDDTARMSANLNYKESNVQKIKDHLFHNEHILDRYGPEATTIKQFDPNLEQGLAWLRLKNGTHTEQDVIFLKHEFAERHHEQKFSTGYNKAHERAQKKYDGSPWQDQKEL